MIYDLPFLYEQAKRNILGENAARLFNIPLKPKLRRREAAMALVYVGKQSEFEDRGRKVIARGEVEIGVFRVGDGFYAYENKCPHVRGPACQGRILARVEEVLNEDKTSRGQKWSDTDVHIICPWHG